MFLFVFYSSLHMALALEVAAEHPQAYLHLHNGFNVGSIPYSRIPELKKKSSDQMDIAYCNTCCHTMSPNRGGSTMQCMRVPLAKDAHAPHTRLMHVYTLIYVKHTNPQLRQNGIQSSAEQIKTNDHKVNQGYNNFLWQHAIVTKNSRVGD